ncbi:sulfotransferase 6B1-like [Aplysia californica]|uniref:Sulfotransferase 6B1-like n=1 Tax=Aplysia californica TaxID=6500 RepID=A0ABM1A3K9_APLCA|nr:sulfotransferase 6B1-like [Aplysia californica]
MPFTVVVCDVTACLMMNRSMLSLVKRRSPGRECPAPSLYRRIVSSLQCVCQNVLGRTLEDLLSNHTEEDEDGRKLTLFRYNGKTYPPFGEVTFRQLKDMTVRDDDVFLMGYPKTGCHWTFEVLRMMLQGEAKLSDKTKMQSFIDVVNPTKLETLPSPRILNSHVLFEDMPRQVAEKKTKIILTVRNPKDTAASFYNHHAKIPEYTYDGTFNKWFPLYLSGRVDYGSYFDYYKSWDDTVKENPDQPILVLSYEDMKEDLPREIRRLSQFLGISVSDSLVEEICEAAGVNNMKQSFGKRMSNNMDTMSDRAETRTQEPAILRLQVR